MYVIYPAEEIISLTYALPVQRSLPRPTLDNLKEPNVSPAFSPIPLLNNNLHHNHQLNHNDRRQSITQLNTNAITTNTTATIDPDEFNRDGFDDFTSSRHDLDNTNYSVYSSQSRLSPLSLPPKPPPMAASKAAAAAAAAIPKKSKLAKLAKLGRPHSTPAPETIESARVSEYHDIVVSNPTFTRDNLRARNFDAFFESGVPVYQIETKERPQPNSAEILEANNNNNIALLPPTPPPLPPAPTIAPKSSKFNFLKRNKDKQQQHQQQQQQLLQAQPQPLNFNEFDTTRSRRGSHSSDILLIVEDPQKGDRCTPLMI